MTLIDLKSRRVRHGLKACQSWIFALLLSAGFTNNAFGFSIGISGTLPVQSNASQFTFKTTLRDLRPAEVPVDPKSLDDYLKVYVNGDSNVLPLEGQPTTNKNQTFILRYVSDKSTTDTLGTTLEIELEVLKRDGSSIYASPQGDGVKLKVNFASTDSSETQLTRENVVYIEAPSFTRPASILGSQKSLTVYMDPKTEVTTLDKDNTRKNRQSPPVYVYAFPLSSPPLTMDLPAKIYDPKSFDHRDTTCTLSTPNGNSGPCITSCQDENADKSNVYLNHRDITREKFPNLFKVKSGYNSTQVILAGLENDKKYFVFLAYEGGTKASECLMGVPSVNYTLTELNGEADATIVDMRCFIATATYETPLAREVGLFRWYRDTVLSQSFLGRGFISLYYQISPPLAELVSKNATLKNLTLAMLNHVAARLRLLQLESPPHKGSPKGPTKGEP